MVDDLRQMADKDNKSCCPECFSDMKRLLSKFLVDPWKPITLEHAGENPVHFETKKELRSFMRERGWSSGALL